jgi:hypothetical protein
MVSALAQCNYLQWLPPDRKALCESPETMQIARRCQDCPIRLEWYNGLSERTKEHIVQDRQRSVWRYVNCAGANGCYTRVELHT